VQLFSHVIILLFDETFEILEGEIDARGVDSGIRPYIGRPAPNKNDLAFMGIITDLTNSNSTSETKNELDRFYETERSIVDQMKSEVEKEYSNNL
jgi:hypothetical protein